MTEKTIAITGGDAAYFDLLCECVGSLRATPREPEAQELEEGAPADEADIEVPADEILNDVDDVAVDELVLGADAPEIQA